MEWLCQIELANSIPSILGISPLMLDLQRLAKLYVLGLAFFLKVQMISRETQCSSLTSPLQIRTTNLELDPLEPRIEELNITLFLGEIQTMY